MSIMARAVVLLSLLITNTIAGYYTRDNLGMDLGPSYVIVAYLNTETNNFTSTRYEGGENGNTGELEYRSVMRRLSEESSRHNTEPYQSTWEKIVDSPRKAIRNARQAIFLPASYDVGILGEMIEGGRHAFKYEHRRQTIFTASKGTVALYREDIVDAIQHISCFLTGNELYNLDSPTGRAYNPKRPAPFHLETAYWHYVGLGACDEYDDSRACNVTDQPTVQHMDWVLSVFYTKDILTTHIALMVDGHNIEDVEGSHVNSWILGKGAFDIAAANRWTLINYWNSVRGQIVHTGSFTENPVITKILLIGESIHNFTDRAFVDNVRMAVMSRQNQDFEIFGAHTDEDTETVCARGAARMAARRIGGYGTPCGGPYMDIAGSYSTAQALLIGK